MPPASDAGAAASATRWLTELTAVLVVAVLAPLAPTLAWSRSAMPATTPVPVTFQREVMPDGNVRLAVGWMATKSTSLAGAAVVVTDDALWLVPLAVEAL